ncbi:hypothetical protein AD998_06720 [bacterium 336/3]|nr:hypothetical protein AD998_06720 [bacterium 336/3]
MINANDVILQAVTNIFLTMEQVWNNVSLWGVLTVLITSFRVIRQFLKFDSGIKIAQFWRILRYQAVYFIRYEYKIWVVPVLCLTVLAWVGGSVNASVLSVFFWANVVWWIVNVGISHLFKTNHALLKQIKNTPFSILSLGGSLFLNAYLLDNHFFAILGTKTLLAILASSFLGISFVIGSFRLWQYNDSLHPKNIESSFISNERLDALMITLICSILLAQVYGNHINFSLLPLVLSASFLMLFGIGKAMITGQLWNKYHKYAEGGMLLVSIGLTFGILYYYLPASWLKGGMSYQRNDLLYTILVGLLVSFFSDKLIAFYRYLQNTYTYYFLDQPIFHKILTYIVRGAITISIISVISWGFLYAYQHLELYGLTLVLISILTNINSKISFDIPARWQ